MVLNNVKDLPGNLLVNHTRHQSLATAVVSDLASLPKNAKASKGKKTDWKKGKAGRKKGVKISKGKTELEEGRKKEQHQKRKEEQRRE